ncbi:unnamed protein product [Lampetra fluviatilis]
MLLMMLLLLMLPPLIMLMLILILLMLMMLPPLIMLLMMMLMMMLPPLIMLLLMLLLAATDGHWPQQAVKVVTRDPHCLCLVPECWTESKQPKYVGDSWLEGCEQKECLEGGRVLTSAVPCEDEVASSRCPSGVRLVPAPPAPLLPGASVREPPCCPALQCDACVHNGVYHQVGERWNDTANRCVLYSCGLVGGRAAMQEAITSCAPFNFDHCEDSVEVVYDAQGCCPVSCQPRVEPSDSPLCRTFKTLEVVRVGSCNSSELELGHCSGTCKSSTTLDHAQRSVVRACSCCRESLVEQRSATLRCDDGSTRSYAYAFVRACSCLALC